jgi:hypothetical protein
VNTKGLSDLSKNRFWGFSSALNAILKPKLKKKKRQEKIRRRRKEKSGPKKYESLHVYPEKLTHF